MMKLTLAEPKYFTDSISIVSELVNEVTLKVDKDRIELIAMDPANVAMIAFTLLSSAFSEYSVDKPCKLSVNLESLKQVLRRAKGSDSITLSLDEKKNKLGIKIVGESIRSFNLALINLDEKEHKVPDLNFPVKIVMSTNVFDEAIEDMGVIADSLSLTAESDKLVMDSESNLHSAKVELKSDGNTSIELKGSTVTSRYSLEYLKKMIKASKLSNRVKIEFSKDYPLKLDYLVKDRMNLSFILAPRVPD
ncbi:MAG: proliferating cell nuclear antigen (pcna) [Candidatus Woesearchaeota archaeon]